eukprot:2412968-Rhodomonas_salina.4
MFALMWMHRMYQGRILMGIYVLLLSAERFDQRVPELRQHGTTTSGTRLRICYAMPCTDLACHASRATVPT